jgi:hypothetical protein
MIIYDLIPGTSNNIQSQFRIQIMNIKMNDCISDYICCLLDGFHIYGAGEDGKETFMAGAVRYHLYMHTGL